MSAPDDLTLKSLMPNEPVEKISFAKTASSAGSKVGNYILSLMVFGSGNRAWSHGHS
jgi:hypothetical protein